MLSCFSAAIRRCTSLKRPPRAARLRLSTVRMTRLRKQALVEWVNAVAYVDAVVTGLVNFGLFGAIVLFRNAVHQEGLDAFLIHRDRRGRLLLAEGGCFAAGITVLRCVVLIALGKASVHLSPEAWLGTLAMLAALVFAFSGVALFEEGLFRGYMLQRLATKHRLYVAVGGTSLVFGLLHVLSCSWSGAVWLGIANATALGAVLCGIVLRTRSLMFALGYHISWNVLQTLLWEGRQFPMGSWVSLDVQGGLLAGEPSNPETGLATTIGILLTAVYYQVRFVAGNTPRGRNCRSRDECATESGITGAKNV